MDGPHMVAMGVERHDLLLERAAGAAAPFGPGACGRRRAGQAGAEIRLHLGAAALLAAGGGSIFPSCRRVGTEDLSYAVNTASRFSAYAAWSIAQGYLTARGATGWACAVRRSYERENDRNEGAAFGVHSGGSGFPGLAAGLPDRLGTGSALILVPWGRKDHPVAGPDPPNLRWQGGGSGRCGPAGELFPALYQGYQFQTGSRTDVLTGASKAEGMELLPGLWGPSGLPWMKSPPWRTAPPWSSAVTAAFASWRHGPRLSVEDLHRRPVYRRLLQTGMFQTAVVLQSDQTYTVRSCIQDDTVDRCHFCSGRLRACGFSMAASTGLQRCLQQLQNGLELMQCQMEYQMTELPELCAILASACTGGSC